MASDVRKDTTDVYRYKITRTGVRNRDSWDGCYVKGDTFEEISFRGYYMTKQTWVPWVTEGDTLKLELQKLEAFAVSWPTHDHIETELRWVTIRTKIFTQGGEEDE